VTGGPELRKVLEGVASGALAVDEAIRLLPLLQIAELGEFARLDLGRRLRKGVPEVIYAPRKTKAALIAIVRRFLTETGLALATRVPPSWAATLESSLADLDVAVNYDPEGRIFEAMSASHRIPTGGGRVGVLTAGTSDIPVAEEAALVARHMGCTVERAYDVGVAGIHRLLEPLTTMLASDVVVLVVVAGMEGALPSVVAGLVDLPVIGVPTSTGYGLGGDGTAALYSILQSCSPGLVAVNIDNGVGAGAAAALIARDAPR
jgi:NCAIR mutase (PurE)-related protein